MSFTWKKWGQLREMSVSIGGASQYSNGTPFQYRCRALPLLLFNS